MEEELPSTTLHSYDQQTLKLVPTKILVRASKLSIKFKHYVLILSTTLELKDFETTNQYQCWQ